MNAKRCVVYVTGLALLPQPSLALEAEACIRQRLLHNLRKKIILLITYMSKSHRTCENLKKAVHLCLP